MYYSSVNFQVVTRSSILTLRISKAVPLNSGEPGFVDFDLLNVMTPHCL